MGSLAYREGVRLFNEQAFWHAHEQWEACWLTAHQPERTFYQGLIQAAAALVHYQRGNLRGLERNWAKARPKLVALPPHVLGLAVSAFIIDMDRFVIQHGTSELPRMTLYLSGS